MNSRSRGGCVDCKRSKVKCDEARPSCGTCARRRLVCHGYANVKDKLKKAKRPSSPRPRSPTAQDRRTSSVLADVEQNAASSPSPTSPGISTEPENTSHSQYGDAEHAESSQLVLSSNQGSLTALSTLNDMFSLVPLKTVSRIPPGMIHPADEATVEVYFNRHPHELTIGPEFVDEMNANVLMVLQSNPRAISDCLFAVGRIYVADTGIDSVPVLDRKARILANLRAMNESESDLEQIVVMLLGLCALELIDMKTAGRDMTIPVLIQNAALLIQHHISTGREVTLLAKYFIRALARQDMIISLTHFRRPSISTTVWLDEHSRQTADRFMGYTATLMPLLAELCVLAEDVRGAVRTSFVGELGLIAEFSDSPLPQGASLSQRAAHLAARIAAWQPTAPRGLSFRSSRKFLSQAYCYRTAALLYLHRLFHLPHTSLEADDKALELAHNVLLYTTGPIEELRMSLWPVFICACEFSSEDDRSAVLEVFDAILKYRRTATALRTKNFCVEKVWKARDEGREWNWMELVKQYPGELMPI
ncbi:hypothetical protein BP6252_04494 [Coleophoma cylindrospora]|uniref:Zn(2)-C6 fungal-type domain-containing protein n=1 Tax=Coleophoma cylindrospora TaxID=1849047 RepID=A0A3D8S0R1_9HELO|nr:hypothetical protein BP6252_04494 [Coleophoma cylindrospora]